MTVKLSDLKPIRLSDRSVFQECFSRISEPIADSTFAMRFIWAGPFRHSWAMINGHPCVFGFLKGRFAVWGSMAFRSASGMSETFNECLGIVEKLNLNEGVNANPLAVYIPECLKGIYGEFAVLNSCELNYWTQDYIYSTGELSGMNGGNYHSKRREINIFLRNNPDVSVEEFSSSLHKQQCLELIGLWSDRKAGSVGGEDRQAMIAESEAARRLVDYSAELGVRGIVLKAGGRLIGAGLGEQLSSNVYSKIILKTDYEFRGASDFLIRELAGFCGSYPFLDAQDDFGVEPLKRMKLSYHPARLLKSYSLEKK
ncbi:DUF2156 domain-containing protein [Candidatus Woesearchaeota archaeon]|nr:DUF2156 domain-containing protein [Candidatus Woesearchaeota archaeon]